MRPTLQWEEIDDNFTYRTKIVGGWLVKYAVPGGEVVAMTFVPDPDHEWDGSSLS
jgi:hypothetical protein